MKAAKVILVMILMALFPTPIKADDEPYSSSKKVKEVTKILNSLGLNDPSVMALVKEVDTHVKGGYLSLYERQVEGGTLKLHYELRHGVGKDQIELKFSPDDSHMAYTARPNAVMAHYQLRF